MASASCHWYGGMMGIPAYNCYKILVEDFGLRKIREEKGRPY
jgi:hypothetical protein